MNPSHNPFTPAIDPDEVGYNPCAQAPLETLIATRMSRRGLLRAGTAGAALLSGIGGLARAAAPASEGAGLTLNFNPVAKHLADTVALPAGYSATVLYRLGDPIAAGVPAYKNDGTDDPASYDRRAGDHHDGMTWFGMDAQGRWASRATDRGLLVMNHEAITPAFLHAAGQTIVGSKDEARRTDAREVQREFYLHGVSVIETQKKGKTWSYRQDSRYNRRIHTLTDMVLSGPVAGNDLVKTKYAPDGSKTRGTVNNCANGTTPWGTYLTCEENWAGYFRRLSADDARRSAKELTAFKRYGVAGAGREGWATVGDDDLYARWNTEVRGASAAEDYRNVSNTYGWVVEIDPFNPKSTPKKRTALGRFGHEGACLGPVVPGQPLVWYMGDDARNEYIYKFVSARNWDPKDANQGLSAGDKYMDAGTLYVAKFKDDGSGEWLELSHGKNGIDANNKNYSFANQADVLVNTRLAADAVGATRMDRPEWAAIHPRTGDVYVTLTNTNARSRPVDKTNAANPRYYNDPKNGKPQEGNPNGHIVRFADEQRNPAALAFQWDVYLFGARAGSSPDINLSGLTADNDFSSPDGLWFSDAVPGLAWLQTDDGAYTDVTNCMMLAAVPGQVGDGGKQTIVNVGAGNTRTQDTYVGAQVGQKGTQLRRFLVGPKGCEITGIAESGDGRALFVNIQHPGENTDDKDIGDPAKFESHWPDGGNARPRSATLVITRDDGGKIGV
ncbi:PhoX family protein [Hylemonella sp. W303a]|uniref:PhoX family protein n=1 Tax=Hylemonella sp. W303a TaxID=3389873 RepID=UPI00396B09D3